jgi:sulfide dehydrogenase cytochrome subunit
MFISRSRGAGGRRHDSPGMAVAARRFFPHHLRAIRRARHSGHRHGGASQALRNRGYRGEAMLRTLLLSILAAGFLFAPDDAEAQRRRGKSQENGLMLVQSCYACHGPDGSGVMSPMPNIAGHPAGYLASVLKGFRDGNRPSTIMGRIMKGYTDPQIDAIAAQLSTLPYRGNKQQIDPALLAAGKDTYERACKKCHPKGGREAAEPEYPLLAGQWVSYMELTLAEIIEGKRVVDDKFRAALDRRSPEELKAVLHYFAAQE